MSAVIGMETPVKDILELLPGIRIAKVLWDIKSDFFDFFRENGKYNLGITCSPGSPSVSADSRYRVWVKITQSLNDFCKAKVDVLEKSAANFDELRESMANLDSVQLFNAEFLKSLMNDEDRKSMEFFCVIFVILIKTEFPARWDEIETKMEPEILRSFKEYLLKFG
jgi:regulator of replication initiation timing